MPELAQRNQSVIHNFVRISLICKLYLNEYATVPKAKAHSGRFDMKLFYKLI